MGQSSSTSSSKGGAGGAHPHVMVVKQEKDGEAKDVSMLLPDECLGLIFHRLSVEDRNRCSLVCKRWLAVESQGRQLLSLVVHADLTPSIPFLLNRFENLTKLVLKCPRESSGIQDEGLILVGTLCRHLQKIRLKGCKTITDNGLAEFAKACSSLKKFSCRSCQFGTKGLNALLGQCSLLEELTVKRLHGLEQEGKEFVGIGTNRIKRICLKEIANAHLFTPLIAGSPRLKTLILSTVSGNWDRLLEIVAEHLVDLAELHLEKLQLSDRGLRALAQCNSLQVLRITKVPDCGNPGLIALFEGCKHLRKFHVDGCLAGRIGDEGLIHLAQRCRGLQELVLISLNATAQSLVTLATNCTALERLALCNSETFGDAELACIARGCLALNRLCIKGCPISDQGLTALAAGCPSLAKIRIKKCKGISVAGLICLKTSREGLVVSLDPELLTCLDAALTSRMQQSSTGVQRAVAAPSSSPALTRAKLTMVGTFMKRTL
ncbi:hypothetical protein O6H91_09G001400 [Diphasiastrum complanatum]|uniref:Uncharacterized protein n=1 Tax=Diphasiastrum complanatum TaxID=34168 RepID=A0ACC2CKT4_DIPCM|nr:hypothetical protein O6H91_09G001400 [Diphasiastrum complanatum]